MSVVLSEPSDDLAVRPRKWVYRLWAEDGTALYVGQTKAIHPAVRINQHRSKPWWDMVARIDYVEVLEGNLYEAELTQIRELKSKYNKENWLHPSPQLSRERLFMEQLDRRVKREAEHEADQFRDFLLRLLEESLGTDPWKLVKAAVMQLAGERSA